MSTTDLVMISEMSDTDLDAVGAGGRFTQISGLNIAIGIQVAPTVNVALFSAGVTQTGAYQYQFINAGNFAH